MKNYDDWVSKVPVEIKGDSLWKMEAYRLALFIGDIGWHDVTKLMKDRRTLKLSDQLYRSLGSIGANLAEGYSLGTGKNRARFYEYSLGSARESRDWYYKGRYILGEEIMLHRIRLLTQILRLLLTMIPQQRERILREEKEKYQVYEETSTFSLDTPPDYELLETFKENIPLP